MFTREYLCLLSLEDLMALWGELNGAITGTNAVSTLRALALIANIAADKLDTRLTAANAAPLHQGGVGHSYSRRI